MKKLLLFLTIITLISCVPEGEKNAIQYIREKIHESNKYSIDDVQSIDVVGTDSAITVVDMSILFGEIYRLGTGYLQGKVNRETYGKALTNANEMLYDIYCSFDRGMVVNDSLKKLVKYKDMWRKVYTVRITNKSKTYKFVRVMMDRDGVTPFMTEAEFGSELQKYQDEIQNAQENMLYN